MESVDIIAPSGKVISYEEAELGDLEGSCYLCGCKTKHGHPQKKVIKPTFTDQPYANVPSSGVVCEHCTWALSYRSLRNYSIIASPSGLQHPSREEIKELLLSPPEPPFTFTVAESGQKWLHFKTKPNLQRELFNVRFEDIDVIVRPNQIKMLLEPIEELYSTFTKEEIGTGDYKSHKIQEFGLNDWAILEKDIENSRGSSLFNLALFVAQKTEREKKMATKEAEVCIMDFKQKTKTPQLELF